MKKKPCNIFVDWIICKTCKLCDEDTCVKLKTKKG